MYYFELFDAVMLGIMMVLLIAFAVSVTHATMKTKLEVVMRIQKEQLDWIGVEYSTVHEDLYNLLDEQAKVPAMILKAKREHGKKIRKAAERKLERTEREYEQRLQLYKDSLESAQASNNIVRGSLGEIRAELSAFQGIVGQELENFVRLPSVRNKMLAAINQQHKAWKEL